jgi:MerR family transcriptional regulator, repressor of the yfmOP operon
MSATAQRALRIGEVAELTGTTPRTIRYYEEIGLLGGGDRREQGKHRLYTEADVQRFKEIVRLRNLLGLTLEQLSQLLEAEDARAELRREYHEAENPEQRRAILDQALGHIETQLELVRSRRQEIEQLEGELADRRELVLTRLAEL